MKLVHMRRVPAWDEVATAQLRSEGCTCDQPQMVKYQDTVQVHHDPDCPILAGSATSE